MGSKKLVISLIAILLVINSFVLVFFIKKTITGETISDSNKNILENIPSETSFENKENQNNKDIETDIETGSSYSDYSSGSSSRSSSSGGGGGSSNTGNSDNENQEDEQNDEEQDEEKIKPEHFKLENPTTKWANFYGNLEINNKLAEPGDEIAAYDSDGNLCGVFLVKNRGQYGFLHVYGDDSLTDIDEGAVSGEKISFKVFDLSENQEKPTEIIKGNAIWKSFETINIDLKA